MRPQSCEPCVLCETGCGKIVTPAGLACRECADELAADLRGGEGGR